MFEQLTNDRFSHSFVHKNERLLLLLSFCCPCSSFIHESVTASEQQQQQKTLLLQRKQAKLPLSRSPQIRSKNFIECSSQQLFRNVESERLFIHWLSRRFVASWRPKNERMTGSDEFESKRLKWLLLASNDIIWVGGHETLPASSRNGDQIPVLIGKSLTADRLQCHSQSPYGLFLSACDSYSQFFDSILDNQLVNLSHRGHWQN